MGFIASYAVQMEVSTKARAFEEKVAGLEQREYIGIVLTMGVASSYP